MAESSTKEDTAMEEEEEEEESMAGNVEVDESPLKPCLNRNKECMQTVFLLSSDLKVMILFQH